MNKEETIGSNIIESSLKLPFVKVDRREFLIKIFKDKVDDYEKLIEDGPTSFFSKVELDSIADRIINKEVLASSGMSFAAGVPGGVTMAATIPADIIQFYGYALRLAQEISYIYGYENILDDDSQLTEEGKNTLILYLGIMLGVSVAGSTVRLLSVKFSQQLLKTLPRKALMKTMYYPVIKKVLKHFGVVVTKKTFSGAVSKVIPIIGGGVSGGINYVTLKSLSKKLKIELGKIINYTEDEMNKDIEILEGEFVEISRDELDNSSKIDEIKKAHELYLNSVLTEDEFNTLKKQILNS